mmetsp:Transcript_14287/g.39375  ORF Transcript_14287/g.39375 Transcript_14287/m.39375 type:complete len:156 (+) Transcript_14287:1000-1467(+)
MCAEMAFACMNAESNLLSQGWDSGSFRRHLHSDSSTTLCSSRFLCSILFTLLATPTWQRDTTVWNANHSAKHEALCPYEYAWQDETTSHKQNGEHRLMEQSRLRCPEQSELVAPVFPSASSLHILVSVGHIVETTAPVFVIDVNNCCGVVIHGIM